MDIGHDEYNNEYITMLLNNLQYGENDYINAKVIFVDKIIKLRENREIGGDKKIIIDKITKIKIMRRYGTFTEYVSLDIKWMDDIKGEKYIKDMYLKYLLTDIIEFRKQLGNENEYLFEKMNGKYDHIVTQTVNHYDDNTSIVKYKIKLNL
jgi:hypothetical protein